MRKGSQMIYGSVAVLALLGMIAFASADASASGNAENPVVIIETSEGPITIELDAKNAPISVENFLGYVGDKYYDGLVFHRVISDFMIQGGGMDDKLNPKQTKAAIKNEASNGLKNVRGSIAMARQNSPNTATSQFFISTVDNTENLGPGGVSPAGYAVFGKVIEGLDTVDKIRSVPTGVQKGMGDVPLKPVYIKSVKRKS